MKFHYSASENAGESAEPWVALVGNPNSGKTAIFNLLTGLNQKVSNYPGVTVEKKTGLVRFGSQAVFKLLDLPGTYSLTPESLDERIVAREVVDWIHGPNPPAAILSVVDASNLSRNLYLTSQLQDLGIPIVVALNMMDRVDQSRSHLDADALRHQMGVTAVIPLSAKERWGLDDLKLAVQSAIKSKSPSKALSLKFSSTIRPHLSLLQGFFISEFHYTPELALAQALRVVTRQSALDLYQHVFATYQSSNDPGFQRLISLREETVARLEADNISHRTLEASLRYQAIDKMMASAGIPISPGLEKATRSEKMDRILTHRFFGPLIFVTILYFIFQSIFTWATVPMNALDAGMRWFGQQVMNGLPEGILQDVLVEGVIGGVGAIIIFLPQILLLVFFLALLEDSGYMARVAFMLDRLMRRVGLHGRSVLPLMSGYACAIPGIMATRTIDSWKDRLITILILPLMSCSARIPIYTLMIAAFIPATTVWGFLNLQGLTLVFMYFLGTATALVLAKVFSRFIKSAGTSSFVMELPPYRTPILRSVLHQVYARGKLFIKNAGKIILAISIVLWFLASYPKVDSAANPIETIQNSYAGKIGHVMEPVIKPLGFDWKIGVGLLTSFAAREVVVSTLATLYNVESANGSVVNLSHALREDRDPETGLPLYSPLMAVALMVFYVFAAQCMATFAIVRHETNSWRWPLFMIIYMTGLAYFTALIVFQGGKLLGFG